MYGRGGLDNSPVVGNIPPNGTFQNEIDISKKISRPPPIGDLEIYSPAAGLKCGLNGAIDSNDSNPMMQRR